MGRMGRMGARYTSVTKYRSWPSQEVERHETREARGKGVRRQGMRKRADRERVLTRG